MAQQSSEIELAWSALSSLAEIEGWRTIQVSSPDVYVLRAGRRSPSNEEYLLLGFPYWGVPAAVKLPEGQGFLVERVDIYGDGKPWLALSRKPAGNKELFLWMVTDVANAIAAEESNDRERIVTAFLRRVSAWQEFMRKGAQLLSPEEEIGLIGELALLRAMVRAGADPEKAVESWIGPLGGLQDFNVESGAFEVKTTLATVGFPARIGSLEQLDDSKRQPIFVAAVRLHVLCNGQNLENFVVETSRCVVHAPTASRLFSEKLMAAGYVSAHAEQYKREFGISGMRIVQVGGEFPKLTPGNVPLGVTHAAYEIDLDKAIGESMELSSALKILGAL